MIELIIVICCIYLGLKVLKGVFKLFVFIVGIVFFILLFLNFIDAGGLNNIVGTMNYLTILS